MESHFFLFVTLGLLFILLLILFRTYWTYRKKVAGFPFYNILLHVAYCQITGKISKDTPINHVLFEQLVKLGKRHLNEGIFMTYAYQPTLMVFGKEAIQVFANEKAALDKSSEYKIADQLMGNGITNSNGEKWRRHRKLISPVFNMAVLKDKVSIFNEHAEALVKDMGKLANEADAVHIDDVLKFHYLNNLSESILGLKQSEEMKAQVVKIFGYVDNLTAMLVQQFLYPWLRPQFLLNFFPSGRRFLQQYKEIGKFINDTLLNMKKHVTFDENEDVSSFGNHLRKSFTYILLKHHSNNPEVFTFEHLRDETKTILVAGYDTVTFATMWCLYSLGSHPEIQEKVYNEILSTTSDYITYEECSNLTYLEAVIMETLRLYPPIPIFSRNLSEDVQFGKYKVLKGTGIAFFAYLAHRDPKVYPDPEKFEPERFLNSEVQRSWSYIPFSEGSRSCIGKNYALIEMKIFLAHLLRNFKFTSLDRREDIKLCWTIALTPTKHLRFKITKR